MSRDRDQNFTRDAGYGESQSSSYSDEDPRQYYGTHQNEEDELGFQRNNSRPGTQSAEDLNESGLDYKSKS